MKSSAPGYQSTNDVAGLNRKSSGNAATAGQSTAPARRQTARDARQEDRRGRLPVLFTGSLFSCRLPRPHHRRPAYSSLARGWLMASCWSTDSCSPLARAGGRPKRTPPPPSPAPGPTAFPNTFHSERGLAITTHGGTDARRLAEVSALLQADGRREFERPVPLLWISLVSREGAKGTPSAARFSQYHWTTGVTPFRSRRC